MLNAAELTFQIPNNGPRKGVAIGLKLQGSLLNVHAN